MGHHLGYLRDPRQPVGNSQPAIFRMLGTVIGIAIMLIYLAFFPFHVIGLAVCLGVGALLCRGLGRNDLVIVTLITIAVIMIDAGNPTYQAAWVNPALRFGDSLTGAVSGLLVVAITSLVVRAWEPEDARR